MYAIATTSLSQVCYEVVPAMLLWDVKRIPHKRASRANYSIAVRNTGDLLQDLLCAAAPCMQRGAA